MAASPIFPSYLMSSDQTRERLTVVIAGHVDHGKSTVIGRLLADTGSLPEGKLDQVRALCVRTGRPFEYAYLLDALKDERAQGITIDTARVFLNSKTREYLVLDAPGHVEFVRNLVTGASRAEAAVLVIDAHEGVRENSRRHGYLLGLLGVSQLVVVVNKMDLAGYDEGVYRRIVAEYNAFLTSIGLTPAWVIPASAREGANIVARSDQTPWYQGPTVLDALEGFEGATHPAGAPFRMPVQDVYKFTGDNDDRRIIAGTIESGRIAAGDEVVFYPSGKHARVQRIESFSTEPTTEATAGQATGFTLDQQIYVTRGELAAKAGEPRPDVTSRLRVGLFWLGRRPLVLGREYQLKLGTTRVPMQIETIHRSLDAASLEVRSPAESVERHEVAECTVTLGRAIALDPVERVAVTARFVIVDQYDIAGGGLVREALSDAQMPLRDRVLLRNYKWETSFIPSERRAERYRQQPTLLLLTGPRDVNRKSLAKALESRLFEEGQIVYYLGMANLLYGVDADLGRATEDRAEHMRRLAEIANLLLDAGVLLLVSAAELTRADLDLIRTAASSERIVTVWLGDRGAADLPVDLYLSESEAADIGVQRLRALLAERGAFLPSEAGGADVS
jgi:bifunctional enzyme CysN/CysC